MKKSNSIPSIISELNGNVENYLVDNAIKVRNGTSPGLWLCFMLPASVVLGTWNHPDCSYFYRTATCLSVGLLLNSLTIIFQVNHSTQFRTACCAINSVTTTLLLSYFSDHSLLFNILLGVISSFGFNKLLLFTLQMSPGSFTFGEAAVVVQAVILFSASVVGSVFSFTPLTCIDIATTILQVGISGLAVLCLCVYCLPHLRSTVEFYTALGVVLVVIVVWLHVWLGFSAVLWLINLAIEDMLTVVRVLRLPPLATVLDSVFQVFADEKDSSLALTPIYLLVGCSAPVWLHPAPASDVLLPLLAGLLSVGVGDTAASICGSCFGKHHWPDSQKTKEGSAACFISQLFFVLALIHFGYVPRNNLLQPIAAIAVVSLVEATTDQIDNLALPLVMYPMLL